MRRLLVPVVVALALAMVASGSASAKFPKFYEGRGATFAALKLDKNVSIGTGKKKKTAITRFRMHSFPFACAFGGPTVIPVYQFTIPIATKKRRKDRIFDEFDAPRVDLVATVKGRIYKRDKKAKGTFRLRTFGANPCDSGKIKWKARKVPIEIF